MPVCARMKRGSKAGIPPGALRLGCFFVNARRGQAGYGHGLVSSWVITGKRRSDRNRDICKNLIIKEIWPARQNSNLRPLPPEGSALSS